MQYNEILQEKFAALGARVKFSPWRRPIRSPNTTALEIDIRSDRRGEYFDFHMLSGTPVEVLDVQKPDRHLLLMVRNPAPRHGLPDIKHKFLCGHDERHWFVAAVPDTVPVSTVVTAKQALKPDLVRDREQMVGGKQAKRHRRRTETFVRQGEWFFIPDPTIQVPQALVRRHEPLGGRKPHVCEELYRVQGETVYVNFRYPNGLTEKEYSVLLQRDPSASRLSWRVLRRNPTVYVRGRVRHSDHATLLLDGWHRVLMNTENQSTARTFVAFLD